MEKNKDERSAKIEEAIKELPEKARQAMYGIIAHWDFVVEMCKNTKMTNEEIEKNKEYARAKEDYTMLALLCATQTFNSNDETTYLSL